MKKILIALTLSAFVFACTDSNKVEEDDRNDNNSKQEISLKETTTKNLNAFETYLEEFNNCKKNTSGRGKCKEFLAKAVCEYYGIEDLKEGENYIAYDEIPKKLNQLESWENIGEFNDENILSALDRLNNSGKPVLIYNKNASYVHVVALKPNGKIFKSGKWGNISVPSCVSYFPKRKDSFTEKGINYAFKAANDLTIWAKK